jgi:antitoxin component YwqK of YwqJK toxin-antitoxin module
MHIPANVEELEEGKTVVISNHESTGFQEKQYTPKYGYLKHGEMKYWHKNGSLRLQQNYDNGEKHGVQKLWDEDGKKLFELNYKSGQLLRDNDKEESTSDGKQVSDVLEQGIIEYEDLVKRVVEEVLTRLKV